MNRSHTTRAVVAVLVAGAVLSTAGCRQVGRNSSMRGTAPGLGDDAGMARNVADPNAPFSVRSAHPMLTKREALLDVNGVPPCSLGQLTLFESRAQSNGARHTLRFSMSNTGEACRLSGFPAISLLRADGSVLGDVRIRKVSSDSMTASLAASSLTQNEDQSEDTLDSPSPQVLLPARGEAAFQLGWTAGPACEQVSRIAIAAPGATRGVVVARPIAVCEDQILITAVGASDPN